MERLVPTVTTGGWTTESATQACLMTDQQVLLHGRLPESCHMTRVAGTGLVLHVRNSLHLPLRLWTTHSVVRYPK